MVMSRRRFAGTRQNKQNKNKTGRGVAGITSDAYRAAPSDRYSRMKPDHASRAVDIKMVTEVKPVTTAGLMAPFSNLMGRFGRRQRTRGERRMVAQGAAR